MQLFLVVYCNVIIYARDRNQTCFKIEVAFFLYHVYWFWITAWSAPGRLVSKVPTIIYKVNRLDKWLIDIIILLVCII